MRMRASPPRSPGTHCENVVSAIVADMSSSLQRGKRACLNSN
jgi:hypothetical protein